MRKTSKRLVAGAGAALLAATGLTLGVRVCFQNGGCQSAYKLALANEWTVIATDVMNGTTFRFQFETASAASGAWAA